MEKMKGLTTVFTIFLLWMGGCTDPPPKLPPSKPVNIIVILDTSDRVSKEKNPEQAEEDTQIATGIISIFEEELVRPELYIGYPHQLAFVVPTQDGKDTNPLNITKDTGGGAPQFKKMKKELIAGINGLYQDVNGQVKFTGSDIWDWFRKSAKARLQKDALNYIICISDGYLDFDADIQKNRPSRGNKTTFMQVAKFRNNPDWEKKFDNEGHGLLITEDFTDFRDYNVKLLIIEIKLRYMLDRPIIEKYWQTWLDSMGITHSEFWESQDDTSIVIEKIKEFISTD